IELQAPMWPQDNAAITGPHDRGADDRIAETGVVPADDDAAVGIVHLHPDVVAVLRGGEFRLSVGRSPKPQPARCYRRPPAEVLLGSGAVEAADIAHIDETLGREVQGALAQCPR